MSPLLRQNCSWLDVELIKLFRSKMLKILSSLLILFILQDKSLIHLFIYINCTSLLYLKILELSLTRALATHFGIALVVLTSFLIDKEIKQFNINPSFPCKLLWDFNKKEKFNSILQNWQMTFQALNYKGNNFLDLTDNDNFYTKPIYMKNST